MISDVKYDHMNFIRIYLFTFFPRITAPASPWITMYFVPPRKRPVGARVPGSAKSFIMAVISSGLNCKTKHIYSKVDRNASVSHRTQRGII